MKDKRNALGILLMVATACVFAQPAKEVGRGSPSRAPHVAQSTTQPPAVSNAASAAAPPQDAAVTRLSADVQTIATSLGRVESGQASAKQEVLSRINEVRPNPWLIFFSGLSGGLFVALINWLNQKSKNSTDVDLARQKASFDAAKEMIGWRIRQLEQLYGPLSALLGQSKGVYDQLMELLIAHDGQRFRAGQTTDSDYDVLVGGTWMPFKLVDQLADIYADAALRSAVEPLAVEVLKVGKRIVKTIHSNAGLALPRQADLRDLFARYLAHFAVLNELHDRLRQNIAVPLNYGVGAYPRELNKAVNDGLQEVTSDIDEWEGRLKTLAESASTA